MPAGAVFGLVACFLISFALVGAAFFAWWAIHQQLKAIPDVKTALAPLEVRLAALEAEVRKVGEAPATLRKRIDEAEEASKQASKKIESFTGQLGAMKRWISRNLQQEEADDGGQLTFPEIVPQPAAPPAPAANNFGRVMRKVG